MEVQSSVSECANVTFELTKVAVVLNLFFLIILLTGEKTKEELYDDASQQRCQRQNQTFIPR